MECTEHIHMKSLEMYRWRSNLQYR